MCRKKFIFTFLCYLKHWHAPTWMDFSSFWATTTSAYYLGALGTVCASASEVILSESECVLALEALAVQDPTVQWSGTRSTIPGGCSYRPGAGECSAEMCITRPDEGHFNIRSIGAARDDLRPVCFGSIGNVFSPFHNWRSDVRCVMYKKKCQKKSKK